MQAKKVEDLILFKLAVDENLYKLLVRNIDNDAMKVVELDNLVQGVQKIHATLQVLIRDIQKATPHDVCPISLSTENLETLNQLQLLARKSDVELNPIRFLFHAYQPNYW